MKTFLNFILLLLCFCFVSSAMAGYQASGKIYTSSGGVKSPASGATGTLSTNNGSSTTPMTTSNQNSNWYAGWSSGDLSGKKMRGSAALGSFMGSHSWYASSTGIDKGKDITLYSGIAINPGLSINADAVAYAGPGPQTPMGVAVVNNTGQTLQVTGYSAEIVFDESKIQLNGAYNVDSFFDVFEVNIPEFPDPPLLPPKKKATVKASATQGVVQFEPGQEIILNCEWEVLPFQARDATYLQISFHLDTVTIPESDAVSHEVEIILGSLEQEDPYLALNTEIDWADVNIAPMLSEEFDGYLMQWQDPENLQYPSLPYPTDPFLPPELYVYEGDGTEGGEPNEPGLVMRWGDDTTADGNYTAAWKYSYGDDPDYTNCIISVTVIAPQFSPTPPNNQINKVSLGMQNIPAIGGAVRSWYWNCGPGQPIPWNTPVTITIDTSKTGVAAATPTATNYVNNPGFNLTTVQYLIFDENANWVGNPQIAPPPGGSGIVGAWNYWHNLSVTPKAGGNAVDSKWHVKYSQPPALWDVNSQPPLIRGWDQLSSFEDVDVMADDWECKDDRPVTDVHWWGSFIGWDKPYPPQGSIPSGFHIGIWTDVAINDPDNQLGYSHPGMLIWENYCDSYVWNYAGIDHDPRDEAVPDEACFQFAQFLSEDEWFYQEPMIEADGQVVPNVYWLSIAPLYPAGVTPEYKWGWKTREKLFNDDACSITAVYSGNWPFQIFDVWATGNELLAMIDGVEESWDLAFELTTNEPDPTPANLSADIDNSGFVDFTDFAILADQWLTAGP